jgi:transcriptional regulator with XRE-family HTH domain
VDAVKEIRRRKGWSQKDLAEESGVGQDTISGIESGRHEPRPSTLRKLADALDVEVADFFREPAVPFVEAPREAGRLSAIDVALDAARRQIALEKQAMFSGPSEGALDLDQRHANEAMQRLREEYDLDANDAEALVDLALKDARLEEENATLRDRLQEREQAHS